MAKDNNLKDFLTDVADAIREKKGTTDLINPQDFSAEIASIETGGGGESGGGGADEGLVRFIDYDGKVLKEYSATDFLALSALPSLPSHGGLICQGWNWTLERAKTYVEKYGLLTIGASYITDDGKTRLYVRIGNKDRGELSLYITQTIPNGVVIDWGDASPSETIGGTGKVNTTHIYTSEGNYTVTLSVSQGCVLGFGDGSCGLM